MLKKGMGLALAAALAGGALAGCGESEPPVPKPTAAKSTSRPATSVENFMKVSKRVLEAVNATDKDQSTDKLGATTTGPMTVIRQAQYNTKRLLGDSYKFPELATEVTKNRVAISSSKGYPRLAMTVMDPLKGNNLPTMDVFAQGKARENWKLWGSLRLFPGAEFPSVEGGKTGAETVAAESDKGLAASPKKTVEAYVNLNKTGSDAQGLTFSQDALRQELKKTADKNAAAVNGAGKSTMTFAVGNEGPVAMRTSDGGAVVVAQLNYFTTISSDSQHTVTVGDKAGSIASGKAEGKVTLDGKTLTTSNTRLVAFRVPAAKSKDKTISVIGSSDDVMLGAQVQ